MSSPAIAQAEVILALARMVKESAASRSILRVYTGKVNMKRAQMADEKRPWVGMALNHILDRGAVACSDSTRPEPLKRYQTMGFEV